MASNIQNSCDHIVKSVRDSFLNYSIQETPFSMYLTIRKSFSKSRQLLNSDEVRISTSNSNDRQSEEIEALRMKLKKTEDSNMDLKDKLEEAVIELEENHEKIKYLNNVIDSSENKIDDKVLQKKVEQIQQLMKEKKELENALEFSEKNWKELNKVVKTKDKEIHDMNKEVKGLSEVKREFDEFKATVNKEKKGLEKKRKKADKKECLDNLKVFPHDNLQCNMCDVKKDSYDQLRNHERAIHMQSKSSETEGKEMEDKSVQYEQNVVGVGDIHTIESENDDFFESYACYYCEQDINSELHVRSHRLRCHGASKVPSLFSLPVRCPTKK